MVPSQSQIFGELSFVTTASHELKAPLALVRQLSLALERGNISPEEQQRLLRQITLTSERALRLTTDLSRASRLEDSLFELEPINLHYADPEQPVELQVATRGHANTVRIGVRDFGPAVPPAIWRQLQDQLGKTPQPLHARPQSSGLGLYVAQQFATVMNGNIGATRHRDGATFYVDMEASTQLSLL